MAAGDGFAQQDEGIVVGRCHDDRVGGFAMGFDGEEVGGDARNDRAKSYVSMETAE